MRHDTREHHEVRFPVMGTEAHVVVVRGPAHLCERAAAHLASLEAAWSRFRPGSDVSRLNAASGHPVLVSPATYSLIARAVDAWERSDGAFDPTILPALAANGYDRDFAAITGPTPPDDPSATRSPSSARLAPAPGAGVIELDPVVGAVTLPVGVGIDLGGIAKGVAADLVVAELLAAGAEGACVNIGGDLRVSGTPLTGRAWGVAIEREPGIPVVASASPMAVLADGGVATSSCRRRVWRHGDDVHHHVIDPRTGRSAVVPWSSVTAIAGSAANAEPAATAALLSPDAGQATHALAAFGAVGVAFDQRGDAHELGSVEAFLARAA